METTTPQKPILIKAIELLSCLTVFILPLFLLPQTLSPKPFLFIALVEIITACYLWLVIFYPEYRPKWNMLTITLLSFLLISTLAGLFGSSRINSFWSYSERGEGLFVLYHGFLFFLILSSIVIERKVLRTLLSFSLASAVIVALFVFYGPTALGYHWSFLDISQGGGTLGNDSFTGTLFIFNLFFAAYLFREYKTRLSRILISAGAFMILVSPIFLNFFTWGGGPFFKDALSHPLHFLGTARAATAALGIGILSAVLLFFAGHKRKNIKRFAQAFSVIFLLAIAGTLIALVIPHTAPNTFFTEEHGGDRLIYWHQAAEGMRDKPLLGFGPNNFQFVTQKYFDSDVLTHANGEEYWTDKPHNMFLDIGVGSGILGLALYLLIFGCFFWIIWKNIQILGRYTASVFSGLMIAYMLNNFFFFDTITSYALFFLTLAVVLVLIKKSQKSISSVFSNNTMPRKGRVVLGIVLAALAIVGVRYFAIKPLFKTFPVLQVTALEPTSKPKPYKTIHDISPFGGSMEEDFKANLYYSVLLRHISTMNTPEKQENAVRDINAQIADILDASQHDAVTYRGTLLISRFYDLEYMILGKDEFGIINKIKEYAEKAIAISPQNPQGYWMYAQGFEYEKNYDKAMSILEQSRVINPHLAMTHQLILNLAWQTGDKALYKEKLAQLKTEFPNAVFQ